MVRLVKFNREPAFNTLFNRFFEGELSNSNYSPATNIKESDEAFELKVFVPGYKKEQVSIELNENILTVSSEIETKKEESEWRNEFSIDSFNRSFKLPKSADTEAVTAAQIDGVLSIKIPKKKEEQKLKKLISIA